MLQAFASNRVRGMESHRIVHGTSLPAEHAEIAANAFLRAPRLRGYACGMFRASARLAASTTRPASIDVRQRKSPGAHTRWSHGRHGSAPASTDSVAYRASRQGAERTGSVGP